MNLGDFFKKFDWFVWTVSLIIFSTAIAIGYYCGDIELYRLVWEYAGLTWLLWSIIYGVLYLTNKAIKDL